VCGKKKAVESFKGRRSVEAPIFELVPFLLVMKRV